MKFTAKITVKMILVIILMSCSLKNNKNFKSRCKLR